MSVLLACPCGHRRLSDANGLSVCPACGRPLVPLSADGWRSLWPRLTLAAAATLLIVLIVGAALVRLLPARQRETPPVETVAKTTSPAAPEHHTPAPPAPEVAPVPPLEAPTAADRPTLPLLDSPPPLPANLEDSPRPPSEKPPAKPRETPARSVPDLQAKDEFYQHLVISRVSRYRILDLDLGQNVQYALVSRFRVKKKSDDGGMVVEQKVESVRLSNADPALQGRLNELLQKTKGATFTLTVNARREVTKFEGSREAIQVFTGENPLGGPSFLLWSFLDQDGWKELAQLSLFQPPASVRRGERWDRDMTHSWGPLGHWAGKMRFQSAGKQAGKDRYDYLLDLAYKPPRKSAGLPFEVGKSQFQILTARGAIAYQPDRGRVAAAEERFHVRGLLAVSFLGAESAVQMDEMQVFQLRILDRNPLEP